MYCRWGAGWDLSCSGVDHEIQRRLEEAQYDIGSWEGVETAWGLGEGNVMITGQASNAAVRMHGV